MDAHYERLFQSAVPRLPQTVMPFFSKSLALSRASNAHFVPRPREMRVRRRSQTNPGDQGYPTLTNGDLLYSDRPIYRIDLPASAGRSGHMRVHQPASLNEDRTRQIAENAAADVVRGAGQRGGRVRPDRKPAIHERYRFGTPMILECCQTPIGEIGAAHIEHGAASCDGLLDGLPQEHLHAAERMESVIGR